MKTRLTASAHRHLPAAFSLVETVLAMGIMSLAITALLGLLPHGLEMSRKAANSAAETRIVDSIVGQLTSIPFKNIQNQDGIEMHFDDQGMMVDADDLNQSTFFVRIRVMGGGYYFPGAVGQTSTLKRVEIQIVQTPLRRFNFDSAPPKSFTVVPVTIAQMVPNI